MHEHSIVRIVGKGIIPSILLFALYVQFHGSYGPGGGFQAGVIFCAGVILYALVFGLDAARRAVPPGLLRVTASLGVLIYAGTGIATIVLGGQFLDYGQLAPNNVRGQHIGLELIEFGVGLNVFSILTGVFYVFAGRGSLRTSS